MTTHPHLEGLIQSLRDRADAAYCESVRRLQRTECLGADHKMEHGTFTRANLDGFTDASELLGRHFALAMAANELAQALAALPGGGVEYQFEVWQDDGCQAYGSGDTLESIQPEAGHYALMYGQDGPVEVKYFERREIATPTPTPHEADQP